MIVKYAKRVARAALGLPPVVAEEELAYRRLSAMGFVPGAILDVGAYEGNWTRLARRVFLDVPVLMIEPQNSKAVYLSETCAELPGVRFVSAVLSGNPREAVKFYEMETGSSIFPENSNVARTVCTLTTDTLDNLAQEFDGPLFLKIDVQGAELDVLRGGTRTLSRSEIVQLEVAILPYNAGAPTFLQTVTYMDEHDFVPLDYSGFTRVNGRELVQVDILFVKRDSTLRKKSFIF